METTMGRVTIKIRVENMGDVMQAQGRPGAPIRAFEIGDALVDTGATLLCLPPRTIAALGLVHSDTRPATTANGVVDRKVYQGARLTLLGRTCTVDVMEIPEDVPVLIGYIPLENLDLVVDPKSQRVVPNPAHGGKMVMDLF